MSLGDVEIIRGATVGGLVFRDVRITNTSTGFADFSPGKVSTIPAGSMSFKISFNFRGRAMEQIITPSDIQVIAGNESLRFTSNFEIVPDPSNPPDPALAILSRFLPLKVDIDVFASCSNTQQGQNCIRRNPTVTIAPASQSGTLGQNFTYTVTVINNDSAGCPPSVFLGMADFLEPGFQQIPECFRIVLRPGERGSRDIIIKPPPGVCAETKRFREVVVNESAPGFAGFADATINILPPASNCAGRTEPTITIVPINPSRGLDLEATFTITVNNHDDPSCGGSTFKVAPILPAAEWVQVPSSFELFVQAGGSASRLVRIIPPGSAPAGTYTILQEATNTSDRCFKGSQEVTLNVETIIRGSASEKPDIGAILACIMPMMASGAAESPPFYPALMPLVAVALGIIIKRYRAPRSRSSTDSSTQ